MTHPGRGGDAKIPEKRVTDTDRREIDESLVNGLDKMSRNLAQMNIALNQQSAFITQAILKTDTHDTMERLVELADDFKDESSQNQKKETAALKDLITVAKKLTKHIEDADAADRGTEFSKKELKCAIAMGLLTGVIALSNFGSWIVAIVQTVNAAQAGDAPPETGDPTVDQKLEELYSYIKSTSDDEFWSQLSIWVGMKRDWTLYLTDQMAMMNYVIDWFPNLGVWTWANGADKVAFVNELVDAYWNGTAASIYVTVNSFQYAGDDSQPGTVVKLPRAVAGDLVRLALAQIIAQVNDIK
ncbi:hypothetical protein GXW83_24450 [Streptacidiphilus sp. PB12-B1b]|uniref:hypothetical protein n=1 Tax=Streptacidiphilus sp. PB12-B1b TaxID=2705012 RepID=UPI0015FDCCE3|nr:hypothetical protein [Streptacidiphilus sp. PB12-B1b]QMU78389.1 hypothetical protein GXW83_24450 [Streptacidiphilus sp. PB12-B1b]